VASRGQLQNGISEPLDVASPHGRVVDQEHDGSARDRGWPVTPGRLVRVPSLGVAAEPLKENDRPRAAIFEDLEVLLGEVGDRPVLAIEDHDVDPDDFGIHRECRRLV
jgi:hypothetical protein